MTYYDLNMNSKRITSVQDPASAQDVATKNYVDSGLASASTNVNVFLQTLTYTLPASLLPNETLNLMNAGVPPSLRFSNYTSVVAPSPLQVNAIVSSNYSGDKVYLGCENGEFYLMDGTSYTLLATFNSRIRGLSISVAGGDIFILGDFTSGTEVGAPSSVTCNRIARWNEGGTPPAQLSAILIANRSNSNGFNGPVYTMTQASGNSPYYNSNYFYIGGDFTATATGGYSALRFAFVDIANIGSNTIDIWAIDDNAGGSYGFDNIVRDIAVWNNNVLCVGDFTTVSTQLSGTVTRQYANTLQVNFVSAPYSVQQVYLMGNSTTAFNAPMYSCDYSQEFGGSTGTFILGGDATGIVSALSPTPLDYVVGYSPVLLPPYDIIPLGTYTAPCRFVEQAPNVVTSPARTSYVSLTNGQFFKLSGGLGATSPPPELCATLTGGVYITCGFWGPFPNISGSFPLILSTGGSGSSALYPLYLQGVENNVKVYISTGNKLVIPLANGASQTYLPPLSNISLLGKGSSIQLIYNNATQEFLPLNYNDSGTYYSISYN